MPRRGRSRWISLCVLAGALVSMQPVVGEDDDFDERVAAAIRSGRAVVLERLKRIVADPPNDNPMGRIALPLAAVLKAGAGTENPIVRDALARLETLEPRQTYDVACYLFALDALSQRGYKEAIAQGTTTSAAGKKARGPVRDKIARLVNWLVEARGIGQGYWDYGAIGKPGSHRHDYSVTQFAVLGLGIGLEHGVPIPRQVFAEIAAQFVRSLTLTGKPERLRIKLNLGIDDVLESRSLTRVAANPSAAETAVVAPGGWSYTAKRDDPYASMTAAGASSLLVALRALPPGGPRADAEKALWNSYAWITHNFASFTQGSRQYYYTLYSLEKVGDLGDIESFGGHNWYREGAEELLRRQSDNGSWGDYVDSSFALLFLTRATRLKPFAAPRILTQARGSGPGEANRDLVYISRLDGYLSAREVLGYLAESRRNGFLSLAQEITRNYARDARGDLVPYLVQLWGGHNDGLARFARRELEDVTGENHAKMEPYEEWYAGFQRVRALEKKPPAPIAAAELLKDLKGASLKSALLDVASRQDLRDLSGALVGELSSEAAAASPAYRRKVHALLVLWTRAERTAPADADATGWADTAAWWQSWWQQNGAGIRVASRFLRLVEALDAASAEAEVRGIADGIVALGPEALPYIRARLERSERSFHLIEAYERLSGTTIGLLSPGL